MKNIINFGQINGRAAKQGYKLLTIQLNPVAKVHSTVENNEISTMFAVAMIETAKMVVKSTGGKFREDQVLVSLMQEMQNIALTIAAVELDPEGDLTSEQEAFMQKVNALKSAQLVDVAEEVLADEIAKIEDFDGEEGEEVDFPSEWNRAMNVEGKSDEEAARAKAQEAVKKVKKSKDDTIKIRSFSMSMERSIEKKGDDPELYEDPEDKKERLAIAAAERAAKKADKNKK